MLLAWWWMLLARDVEVVCLWRLEGTLYGTRLQG